MKNLKITVTSLMIALFALSFSSCREDKVKEKETVIIEKEAPQSTPAPEEDDDEGISLDIKADEEGNVDLGVEGKVETD